LNEILQFRNLDAHGFPHFCAERGLLILTPNNGTPEEEVSIEKLNSLRSMMDRSTAAIEDLVKIENVRLDPSFKLQPSF